MKVELVWDTGLNTKQKKQYKELIKQSKTDPFLASTRQMKTPWRYPYVVVNENGDVVGAFDAIKLDFEGIQYARAGNPFVLHEYRQQGYMKAALVKYFATRRPAMAFIVDNNKASIALYESLGFREWKKGHVAGVGKGHYYKLT